METQFSLLVTKSQGSAGTVGMGRQRDPVELRSDPDRSDRNVAVALVGLAAVREKAIVRFPEGSSNAGEDA